MDPPMKQWLLCFILVGTAVLAKKPHILYVVADDHGYGDMGYTNMTDDIKTPFMDKLAGEGLILERHYTAWLCTPTRASLMTGKYPIRLGIQDDSFKLRTEECLDRNLLLLPEVVRHNGYATHMIGKWHLGYARWDCLPCMRGFNTAYGYQSAEIDYITHYAITGSLSVPGTYTNYTDFYDCENTLETSHSYSMKTNDSGTYSLDLYNTRAKQIIELHDPDQPLFLYLAMQTVHAPYQAPTEYYDCDDSDRCTMQAMLNAHEKLLKDVVSYLEEAGMWEDTLLIYHSDNGAGNNNYASNGYLRGYKKELWEGGVRTPSFLHSVNREILHNRGKTSCYVHVSDWYSTIAAVSGGWEAYTNATGHDIPAGLDGIDQSTHLLYNSTDTCPRTQIMLHIDPVKRVAGYYKNQYKLLIGNQDNKASCSNTTYYPLDIGSIELDMIQLFDVFSDPYETTDISHVHRDIVTDLMWDVVEYLKYQEPLQCQLSADPDGYPSTDFPYVMPWLCPRNECGSFD